MSRLPKFYRYQRKEGERTSVCPVCATVNQHVTGKHCGHVHKVTPKGVVFYFWGFDPKFHK